MLSKIIHIVFSLLLFIISTGFSLSKHYCHDQLVNIEIDKEVESCCDDGNCCHTETLMVHLDEDVVSKVSVITPERTAINLFYSTAIELIVSIIPEIKINEFYKFITAPPLKMQTVLSSLQTYLL